MFFKETLKLCKAHLKYFMKQITFHKDKNINEAIIDE